MKVLCAAGLMAMTLAAQGPVRPTQQGPPDPATQHAPDGTTTFHIQSIDIPPLQGAPFVARVDTDWTHTLADGSQVTVKNHRTVARDSAGRIFQERRGFSPTGDVQETRIDALEYTDPIAQEFTSCNPQRRTCYVTTYLRKPLSSMPVGMTGLKMCGCASAPGQGITIQQQALGQQELESVNAIGSQEITTLPAGMFGNKSAEPIVKQFWYAPQLGINLVTKRFDPRSGAENFIVSRVSLAEPDVKLFDPPADYAIIRQMVVRPASTPNR